MDLHNEAIFGEIIDLADNWLRQFHALCYQYAPTVARHTRTSPCEPYKQRTGGDVLNPLPAHWLGVHADGILQKVSHQ